MGGELAEGGSRCLEVLDRGLNREVLGYPFCRESEERAWVKGRREGNGDSFLQVRGLLMGFSSAAQIAEFAPALSFAGAAPPTILPMAAS